MSEEFFKAMIIRAIHTFAETVIATIGATAAASQVDWFMVMDVAVLAALLSVLKSIVVGMPEVDEGGMV